MTSFIFSHLMNYIMDCVKISSLETRINWVFFYKK
nr:MAG TPA: hypothetical protein [Caudoviricetes sp.]